MRDVIQKMLEAEAEAKRIVAGAEAQAEQVRADARKAAQQLLDQARADTRTECEAVIEKARLEADARRQERLREAAGVIDTEVTMDESSRARAVEVVVRCVRSAR